jgi:hypothetical protein
VTPMRTWAVVRPGPIEVALRALDQGGTLAVAGIHLSDVPALN